MVSRVPSFYERLFQELNIRKVRYMVAGGLAAILYGVARETGDADLFVDLDQANLLRLVEAIGVLGLKPRVPVPARDFADPVKRETWQREKNMVVFTFWNPKGLESVDILLNSPVLFEQAYRRRRRLGRSPRVSVVSPRDLMRMKTHAARPKDLADIRELRGLGLLHG